MAKKEAVILLQLKLSSEWYDEHETHVLKKYADVADDLSITRTVLIPADMTLHSLHYTIQRLFGWQNSHLHSFKLEDKDFERLTDGNVKKWSNLVGLLFFGMTNDIKDRYWDDDYNQGNFNTWMKKKYTGPYQYGGYIEKYEVARSSVKEFLASYPVIEVKESFHEFSERTKNMSSEMKGSTKTIKTAAIVDLTIEELRRTIMVENGLGELLERIKVEDVLGCKGDDFADYADLKDSIHGALKSASSDKLIYNYDYGDNWIVEISRSRDLTDFIEDQDYDMKWIHEAYNTVLEKHQPVCIGRKGKNVMDDVGGMGGFVRFLDAIYNSDDEEEKELHKTWAKSMGWSNRRPSLSKML